MNIRTSVLVAALAAAVGASPALADKGGKGKGGGKHDRPAVSQVDKRGAKQARVHDDRIHRDRRVYSGDARVYAAAPALGGCPPGLAKKNNGCLPPGQAKKLGVGQPLPAGAVYTIPPHINATLPAPPLGHRYAIVNGQVVLVSERNIIVDILRSLVG